MRCLPRRVRRVSEETVRDLRIRDGEVLDRLSRAALLERFRSLPQMDPEPLRRDVDAVLDQSPDRLPG